MTLICQRCGNPNPPSNFFCARCGADLRQLPPPQQQQLTPQQKKGMSLGAILALVFGGLLVFSCGMFGILGSLVNTNTKTGSSANTTASSNNANKAIPTPATPADHLREAKQFLQRGQAAYYYKSALEHLRQIPSTVPEYGEAQKIIKEIEPKLAQLSKETEQREAQLKREQMPALRERLKDDYRETVAQANSHLNYIDAKITSVKGGHALWATHEFFSQYTFSAGDDARVVSAWIDRNRQELKDAGIVRVGVMGRGEFASWCWLDVK